MRIAPRLFASWLAVATLAEAVSARADDEVQPQALPVRTAGFSWDKGVLRTSFGVRDALDADVAKKLSSGITTTIAIRAYVFRDGADTPIALAVRTCKVVYDVWDEVFRVRISGPGEDKNVAVLSVDAVARQCVDIKDLPVLDSKNVSVQGRAHFVGVITEVNPVSRETLEQMRRWVSRPAGSTGIGPGDALFGSFVGLFVRHLGVSDKTVRFRTALAPQAPP
jgi:hypothetical protein